MKVLVTGSNGQLGNCLFDITMKNNEDPNRYLFFNRNSLDITKIEDIERILHEQKPDFVVNCAAYTNVKGAETEIEKAYAVNSDAVMNLTKVCAEIGAYLIHISTDFVFGGTKTKPYTEEDAVKPLNVYGMSKLSGEKCVLEYRKGIVIRTSWLYSEYGKNFYGTMLQRIMDKKDTKVVDDQIGSPTYAMDLARVILSIIDTDDVSNKCGLYHFSNRGQASWYDFASSIEVLHNLIHRRRICTVDNFIDRTNTKEYGDTISRPKYSVMNTTKIEKAFGIKNRHWMSALVSCIKNDDLTTQNK